VTTPPPTTQPPVLPNAQYAAPCGQPLPSLADAYGFKIKVQLEPSKQKKILNASPQVNNPAYCAAAGFGTIFCNTRKEDDPSRVPCDHYISGVSGLSGLPGPNWYQEINGQLLKCPGDNSAGDAPDCHLKAENQYLLDVYAGGTYKACGSRGSTGTCGVCTLDSDTFNTVHKNPAGLCSSEGDNVVPPRPE